MYICVWARILCVRSRTRAGLSRHRVISCSQGFVILLLLYYYYIPVCEAHHHAQTPFRAHTYVYYNRWYLLVYAHILYSFSGKPKSGDCSHFCDTHTHTYARTLSDNTRTNLRTQTLAQGFTNAKCVACNNNNNNIIMYKRV